ncbi:hypothetical protein AVEN_177505-1 [Araneus ventricosus]|uniref:Uncharacterized protein n=1 Tax=Araneus ventricosus TaxID=182803 RepID=A0A4Y2D0K8_ARAVE|nr:hypothetical protein AVEN_177505-1 [Araneus ventricosus]
MLKQLVRKPVPTKTLHERRPDDENGKVTVRERCPPRTGYTCGPEEEPGLLNYRVESSRIDLRKDLSCVWALTRNKSVAGSRTDSTQDCSRMQS